MLDIVESIVVMATIFIILYLIILKKKADVEKLNVPNEVMVYVATKIDDNTVIRSSVPVNNIRVFTSVTLKYYIAIILLVFVLSLFLAVKLVKIIVYPINELQKVTSKIENGDLNKRAIIYNYDEIGFLAQTFNNIADQLEIRIIDSLDKKNKLEAILESMESGVIAIDNNENIILINSYSQKLFD